MLFLANIAGWVVINWRRVAIAAGIVAVLICVAVVWRRCSPQPKLDEQQIQRAQQAIAKQDREKMLEVLAESDTAEDAIDSNIKAIENARESAKKNYSALSNEDLAAELNKRAQQ